MIRHAIVKDGMGAHPYHHAGFSCSKRAAALGRCDNDGVEQHMRIFGTLGLAAAAVAIVVGFGTITVVAQDKEAAIKTRRDTMKRQGDDFKAIQEYVKGEGDQAGALKAINDLESIAPKIPDLFPAGTGLDAFPGKTGAKPEIWKEWDKFKAIPAVLLSAEEKLGEAIKSGDKGAVGAQLANTGRNGCGACHTTYREKLS
jgi:cytochrome c556